MSMCLILMEQTIEWAILRTENESFVATDVVQGDQKSSDAEAVMLVHAGRKAEITLLLLQLLNVMLGVTAGNSGNAITVSRIERAVLGTYHVRQKTALFYFCNVFIKSLYILIIFGVRILQ